VAVSVVAGYGMTPNQIEIQNRSLEGLFGGLIDAGRR
jgi:hypothetical protein